MDVCVHINTVDSESGKNFGLGHVDSVLVFARKNALIDRTLPWDKGYPRSGRGFFMSNI